MDKKPRLIISSGNIRMVGFQATSEQIKLEDPYIKEEDLGSWLEDTFEIVKWWKVKGLELSKNDIKLADKLFTSKIVTLKYGTYSTQEVWDKRKKESKYKQKDFSNYISVPINEKEEIKT